MLEASTKKEKKKKNAPKYIPRVLFAIEIKDNYVHVLKDCKPIIGYYFFESCSTCKGIEKFLLEYICEHHLNEINAQQKEKNKTKKIETCSTDLLFPLRISVSGNEPHHKVLYRFADVDEKHFFETVLLDKEYKSERGYCTRLKTSLHLLPSQNKWKPQKHQEDAAQWYRLKAWSEPAILIHWGLGSGKTYVYYYMVESARDILPKTFTTFTLSVQTQLLNIGIIPLLIYAPILPLKTINNPLNYLIVGYTQFEKMCKESPDGFLNDQIVVIDECHSFRNLSKPMKTTLLATQFAYQIIGATGTLFINDVQDILGTIILMKGGHQRSERKWNSPEELDDEIEYWKHELFEKKNHNLISKVFLNRTYYFDPQIHDLNNIEKAYPLLQRYSHRVPMSLTQMFEYLLHQKRDLKIANITFSSAVRNAYNTVLKSLSNTTVHGGMHALKFQKIVQVIREINNYPQVIFSRFREQKECSHCHTSSAQKLSLVSDRNYIWRYTNSRSTRN